jgi:hypothetical protein
MSAAERVRVLAVLQDHHRGEVIGAIAGIMANMMVQYLMGGPRTETSEQLFARFALGCRAFLAAYEART